MPEHAGEGHGAVVMTSQKNTGNRRMNSTLRLRSTAAFVDLVTAEARRRGMPASRFIREAVLREIVSPQWVPQWAPPMPAAKQQSDDTHD